MNGRALDDGSSHYLLGHSERELKRLDLQGEIYRASTVRSLEDGGIRPGMRVLDLGCGTGDVSLTVAELVGPTGWVVGIDRSAEGFTLARTHAAERGLDNVEFVQCEVDAFTADEPFDALVGRWVLMHLPDPVASLRHALHSVRAGGVVVMIETHIDLLEREHSEPFSELYDRLVRWKAAVVRGAGAHTRTGPQLRRIFVQAGLPDPKARLDATLEGGPDSLYYRYMAESTLSMLPEAKRLGMEGFDPEELASLEQELRDEVVRAKGVLMAWPVVTAWAVKPDQDPPATSVSAAPAGSS